MEKTIIKNKEENKFSKTNQSGFIKLIIFIVIGLFLLKYFNISINDIIYWIKELLNNVF